MNDLWVKRWQATSLAAAFKAYDERKHPRHPKGTRRGGKYAPKPDVPVPQPTETAAPSADSTPPWEMTREQFAAAARRGRTHAATGRWSATEQEYLKRDIQTPLGGGQAAGYSADDIAHHYVALRGGFPGAHNSGQPAYLSEQIAAGYDPFDTAREELITHALWEGYTVPDAVLAEYPQAQRLAKRLARLRRGMPPRQSPPTLGENHFPPAGYAVSAQRNGNFDPAAAAAMKQQDPALVAWYERGQSNLYAESFRNTWKAKVARFVLQDWVDDPAELSRDTLSIWAYGVDRLFPDFAAWHAERYTDAYADADPFAQQDRVRALLATQGDYPDLDFRSDPDPTKKSYFKANEFIMSWAKSSNDRDMRSLGKQMAAAQEFDQHLSDWQQDRISEILDDRAEALALQDQVGRSLPDRTRFLLELPRRVDGRLQYDQTTAAQAMADIRKVLRRIYRRTQDYLASYPQPTIRMYRGVRQFGGEESHRVGEVVDITQNAVEAWAAKYAPAEDRASHPFGRETQSSTHGFVVAMDVPKERILAIPYTAQGSLPEYEMLILGGTAERDEAVVTYVSGA